MRFKLFASIICLCVLGSLFAFAKTTSKKPAPGKNYATVLKATTQRTLPGQRDGEIITDFRIRIVWKSRMKPESFFWHPAEGGWMTCNVRRLNNGDAEEIDFKNIKKGDTLEIIPMPGGKYAIPFTLTKSMNNNLFFSVNPGQWLYLPVTNITRLKDIAMP